METTVDSSSGAKPECGLSATHEGCDARDSDPGHELRSTSNPPLPDVSESGQPTQISSDLMDEATKEDIACDDVSGSHCQDPGSAALQHASSDSTEPHAPAAGERGGLKSTVVDVAPESISVVPEASGASSSNASIMHSDDENVKESERSRFKASSVDEERMPGMDLVDDCKRSSLVEATKVAVPVEAYDDRDPASSFDVKDSVCSELREPLLPHVQTDDTKSSQDKEFLLSGENKLGGESLEKEAEVHGLTNRRGAKADAIKSSTAGDSGPGKMPEEQKKGVTSTRTKDASTEVSQEAKQKPVDKKSGKQGKSAGKPSASVKKSGDPQPLVEELRAKEEAETNRKVHESLDNFIKQTIRCEPYMSFTGRPGDKPLQRLRPDVFENHVAGKLARGFNFQNGPDPRDIVSEENRGMDSNSNDNIVPLKDGSTGSAKGIAGLGRGAQHSLKVPPGVVAFTQAAAKGTDKAAWQAPSKIKCERCSREFYSTLNFRRHGRVHRRSLYSEKEDLSKERPKLAAFWDKLTLEEAGSIVHYKNMEIEDLSGEKACTALTDFTGRAALPQGILKASLLILDMLQNKLSVPLSSERLLAILDDASEKTFLCGGTSIAVQRFVFSNKVVPLTDENIVASMGFHIELKLVKAWMADKEAEALRSQQALLKEEEAAQQKRKKLLEKKKLKKIRQKERKGSTSQQVLQELENESVDDEGVVQGMGEEDDSPTGTGSSSSSLASVQDLALPESAELDETDVLAPTQDIIEDHEPGLGEKSDTEKNMSSDEGQLLRSRDGLSQYGRERQEIGSHRGEDLYRREDPSAIEAEAHSQPRPADQLDWDGDFDSSSAQPPYQSSSGGKTEVQTNLYYRKGDQDRIDLKRRDFERYPTQERRPLRIPRDRLHRNDFSEQKSLRDSRGSDTRYGDSHPTAFKPVRKPTAYFMKNDSGNTDLSSSSRLQQYRSKPPGMVNRASSTAGNAQVVWTRKVPQPPVAFDSTTNIQEAIEGDEDNATKVDDCTETSDSLLDLALRVPDSEGGGVATIPDEERMEEKEDSAAAPVSVDVFVGNDRRLRGSGDDVISTEEMMPEDDDDDDGLSGALLVGSLSVPLGKFATAGLPPIAVGSLSVPLGKFATAGLSPIPISVSYASYLQHNTDVSEVRNVRATGSHGESHGLISSQEAGLSSHNHTATGSSSDGSEPLKASTESRSNPVTIAQQGAKIKSHLSSTSPERGENSRQNAAAPPLGNERLAVKSVGSWQTSAGRYVPTKVWRAVGLVGERPDPSEARLFQDLDTSGRSEGERETSPNAADVRPGGSPTQDNEFLREDSQDGEEHDDSTRVVMKTSDYQSILSASSGPFRPSARSESGLVSEGNADNKSETQSDKGVESGISASEQQDYSDFVEAMKTIFYERWTAALASASVGEVLLIKGDIVSSEGEGLNFLDMVRQRMSEDSNRQSPGAAESGSSPSSSVVSTELSGIKPAGDGAAVLSKIFNDSEHTGVGGIRCPSTVDEEALDGASPQATCSEHDAGMRDASTSPTGSEHDMSGSEMASSAPSASGENCSESRGGGVCSYSRHGNSRQERWHQNSRERFPEQRYMARRRAPVEKKDC